MTENKPLGNADSVELLRQVAAGDDQAASEVFERYVHRLTALARSRLGTKLAARLDPEDIVLSAYRSFFVAAGKGRFAVQPGGDLWRLLVEITLHKLYRSSQHHLAQQRSVSREQSSSDSRDLAEILVGREPTPEEAAVAADELVAVFSQMSERDQQAVQLRLQGYEHHEIAVQLGCHERTVRRALNEARRYMAVRGGNGFVPSAARQRAEAPVNLCREKMPAISDNDAPLRWKDFVLHEQIGAGTTGRVYRVTQKRDGRELAVKFLRKSLTTIAGAVRRFLAEAKTVAALDHPAIVPIRGVGKAPGGGLFLLMDILPGPNLEQLARSGQPALADVVSWIAQAAETLHAAHEKGVIHCDLKPSNILLDDCRRACVTDFGFALRRDATAQDLTRLAGTPAFMAPEQADRRWGEISPQTDIWGLGGVLFFLLLGRPPHQGPNVASTLAKVVASEPVIFPEADMRSVPAAIRDIFFTAFRKSRSSGLNRPRSSPNACEVPSAAYRRIRPATKIR